MLTLRIRLGASCLRWLWREGKCLVFWGRGALDGSWRRRMWSGTHLVWNMPTGPSVPYPVPDLLDHGRVQTSSFHILTRLPYEVRSIMFYYKCPFLHSFRTRSRPRTLNREFQDRAILIQIPDPTGSRSTSRKRRPIQGTHFSINEKGGVGVVSWNSQGDFGETLLLSWQSSEKLLAIKVCCFKLSAL